MGCLKCGRELSGAQVFCDSCLASMEKYPVKRDAPLRLPNRNVHAPAKRPQKKKRVLKPEEQVLQLQKVIRWMLIMMAITVTALTLTVGILLFQRTPAEESNTGRNYQTAETFSKENAD